MTRRSGLTIVELLVVIVIVALAASGLSVGFQALTRSRIRSASLKLVAAARFAYSRAVVQGVTVRLLFNLDKGWFSIEESEGPVLLVAAQSRSRDKTLVDVVDPWQSAAAQINQTFQKKEALSPFQPIRNDEGKVVKRYQQQALGDGIRFHRVWISHEPSVRSKGEAALYFFPAGMGEVAVIQLSDTSENVYSVEFQALSGEAKVHSEAYEPRLIEGQLGNDDSSVLESERR